MTQLSNAQNPAGYGAVRDFVNARIEIELADLEQRRSAVRIDDAAALRERLSGMYGPANVLDVERHIARSIRRVTSGEQEGEGDDTTFDDPLLGSLNKYLATRIKLVQAREAARQGGGRLRHATMPATVRPAEQRLSEPIEGGRGVPVSLDGRTLTVGETTVALPIPLYHGVWSAGSYQRGDIVTHDGSAWHCNAPETDEKPGTGKDWQMMVRKGRDGRKSA